MGVGMWDPGDDTKYSLHKPLAADDDTPKYSPDPKATAATAKGSFPTAYWNADFLALLTVAEFTRDAVDWRQMSLPFPPDDAETGRELDYLLDLAKSYRSGERLAEIIDQNLGFLGYYVDLLMIRPDAYPKTHLVIKIACRVAELTMAYYKEKFNRARPSQLRPELMPPVLVTGHPSYPSGHALTAYLISNCLGSVCPGPTSTALAKLADRIAINREIAGFHYPSDTAAGRFIAEEAYRILQNCPSFAEAVTDAKKEWADRA